MGELNPKELSDKVSFTADGRLLWGSLPVVGLDKLFYAYRWSPQEAKDALKSSDKFCILELSGYHWGLLWSTFPVIRIFDPLSGVRFLGKYKITKTVIIKNILKK